jgi:hypothetical protein
MNFQKLLSIFNFDTYPRYYGNPYQSIVYNYNDLRAKIESNINAGYNFISHNTVLGENIVFRQSLFDFDSKAFSPEDFDYRKVGEDFKTDSYVDMALNELLTFHDEMQDYKKQFMFSGSGFYAFLEFEPITIKAGNLKIGSFQKQLNFQSLDTISAEPRHICRLPSLRYKDTKRHTIPINYDLMNKGIYKILNASYLRDISHIQRNYRKIRYDTSEILGEEHFVYLATENESTGILWDKLDDTLFDKMLSIYLEPDFVEIMKTPYQKHDIRFSCVTKLKNQGLPENEVQIIMERLAKNWVDGTNGGERVYQVHHAFVKNYGYKRGD